MASLYQFLTKYGQLISFGIGVVLVILTYLFLSGNVSEFEVEGVDVTKFGWIVFFGMVASAVLIVLCAVIAMVFGIFQMVSNPKGSMVAIIGIAVIALLFIVFYNTIDPASSDSIRSSLEEFNITEGRSKYISGAIWTTVVLIALAAGSFIISEVMNVFK